MKEKILCITQAIATYPNAALSFLLLFNDLFSVAVIPENITEKSIHAPTNVGVLIRYT